MLEELEIMKNYYEILGVPENATTQEIISNGRRQAQKYSVDHVFAGKRLGIDYTDEDWKEANRIYADIIEAYQILKDERHVTFGHRNHTRERVKRSGESVRGNHRLVCFLNWLCGIVRKVDLS